MGLLQKACETYDCHIRLVGLPQAGEKKETLAPVSLKHLAQNLKHLRTVAVLARRAVDCYNFHILFLRVFSIFSARPHCF